jgi:hypothetical protein
MTMQHENGPAHIRKRPEEAYETSIVAPNFIEQMGRNFCNDPTQYEWKNIGKKEMVVPYNYEVLPFRQPRSATPSTIFSTKSIRWEKRRVWIVEGTVSPGESNVLARRRFYIDEDSWEVLLGEAYDIAGRLVTHYMLTKDTISGNSNQGQWYSLPIDDQS